MVELLTIEKEKNIFQVFSDGQTLGKILIRENKYHSECVYLDFELNQYNKKDSEILFQQIIIEIKKPLQVMISSVESQIINFIKEAGFLCKRKCFEVEATKQDYIGPTYDLYPLHICYKGSDEYDKSCNILFKHYKKTHNLISPLTCDYKSFIKILPEKVYFTKKNQKIIDVAFVEDNEIAYVCSNDKGEVKYFLSRLIDTLFKTYENIFFESDDCDEAAMGLYNLFKHKDTVSYDTYIKDYII